MPIAFIIIILIFVVRAIIIAACKESDTRDRQREGRTGSDPYGVDLSQVKVDRPKPTVGKDDGH